MKSKRKMLVIVISTITMLSVLFGTVAAISLSDGGISDEWQNATEKDGVVKYKKPAVGDIAQDGTYPDEVKSDSSANAQEKEWYEYITYSKTPIGEVGGEKLKLVFYDPYDYNYGMIMELSDPESDFGDYYDGEEGYTTANEISVSYSVSNSHSWSSDVSLDFGFEESGGASVPLLAKAELKFTQTVGVSHTQSGSDDSSATKQVTYNAVYFNSLGAPYRWRIVKYKVILPLFCEMQTLVNGHWVVTETNYLLLTTIEGTCREWINEVAYIEDWRTGEPIPVEDFWKRYFDKESLFLAYATGMLPAN